MKPATTLAAAALAGLSAIASEAACQGPAPAPGPGPGGAGPSGASASEQRTTTDGVAERRLGGDAIGGGKPGGRKVVAKEVEGEELLALAEDRLLLWSVQGRARSRNANGEWSELTLPLVGVRAVRAKGVAG